jgi:hypothetical protein
MEQEDFLLREIKKIGSLLKMVFNTLAGKGGNLALAIENQFETEKGSLLETGLDVDRLLALKESEVEEYLSGFNWMNAANIELLADILKEMGIKAEPANSMEYLKKALWLYEFCNTSDQTFSFEREGKIREVKNTLFNP